MHRRLAWALAATLIALPGCRHRDPPLPSGCTESAEAVAAALARAPGHVALGDGTLLSQCVERARGEGQAQDVGVLYVAVADALAARIRTSDAVALRLGFLVGATRRGAGRTNGTQAELVRRLEQAIGIGGAPPERRAAFRRGLALGERRG